MKETGEFRTIGTTREVAKAQPYMYIILMIRAMFDVDICRHASLVYYQCVFRPSSLSACRRAL